MPRWASEFFDRDRFVAIVGACLLGASLAAVGGSVAGAAEHRHVDPRTGVLEIPFEELVAAVRRKDRAETGRVAERLGPARLAEALRRSDAASVHAALTGILSLPGRARLLGAVTELIAGGDPAFAPGALRTLGDILAPLTTTDLDDWEIPNDVVVAACAQLRVMAVLTTNATAIRLAAVDGLADAAAVCVPTPDLVALLRDPTPSLRRAAALMLRPQQRLATGGFASGTRDIDKGVSGASVAAVCELMGTPGLGVRPTAKEPIWEQTRQLARRMAVSAETAPEDAVQMLDCLEPSLASDRQILEGLRGRKRTPLADRAAEILSESSTRTRP